MPIWAAWSIIVIVAFLVGLGFGYMAGPGTWTSKPHNNTGQRK